MNRTLVIAAVLLAGPVIAFAAPKAQTKPAPPAKAPQGKPLPPVPAKPIAKKKELLFADDFNGSERDKRWHRVVDTFTWENGALKGTQTRVTDQTGANGQVIKAHAAVYGLELPTKDSIIEVTLRLDGATMMDIEFDDRKFTGSHYGHLCRAQIKPTGVTILDEREGSQSAAMQELKKDPVANKAEMGKLHAKYSVTYPAAIEQGKSYKVVVETAGEEMRVTIDGKPMAYFKSPGIGHPTKSKIELGVAGQSGWFDDIKIWNAEPVK